MSAKGKNRAVLKQEKKKPVKFISGRVNNHFSLFFSNRVSPWTACLKMFVHLRLVVILCEFVTRLEFCTSANNH